MKDPVTFTINFAISRLTGAVALMAYVALLGLWAGVFLNFSLIVRPAIEAMPHGLRDAALHALVGAAHGPHVKALILACIPAGAVSVIFCADESRAWLLGSLLFYAAALTVTVLANMPLILTITDLHHPDMRHGLAGGLDETIADWGRFNDLRMGLLLMALALALRAMQHHERRKRDG